MADEPNTVQPEGGSKTVATKEAQTLERANNPSDPSASVRTAGAEPKTDEVLQESMIWQPGGKGGVFYDRGTRAADMNEQAAEVARSQGLFDAETVSVTSRVAPHLPAMSGLSQDDASRPVVAPRTVV